MVNWTKVWLLPSEAVDWISSTPLIERTAASTFWVIWVSISVGAAPGCEMNTIDRREVDIRAVVDVHAG